MLPFYSAGPMCRLIPQKEKRKHWTNRNVFLFQNNSIHGDVCMEDRNREKTGLSYVAWSRMDGQTDDGLLIIWRAVRSVIRLENNLHQKKHAAL